MLNVKKDVRDIRRFNEIAGVLFEEGFGYILDKIKVKLPLSKRFRRKSKRSMIKPEKRLRETLERLGPTFIKFGQLLSVRPDIVPKEYIRELEKLQDSVVPFPFSRVKEIVSRELKSPLGKLFLDFEEEPIASASISQVHEAYLKDGNKVAIKVQRPGIKEVMEIDIEIMFFFARMLEKHTKDFKKYRPFDIVTEFAEWSKNELDFTLEARNAQIFYENFRGSKTVRIPRIYNNLTSEVVLTMEFLDGVEINNHEKLKKEGIDLNKAIRNGFEAILTQVYVHGFFHGDPHPGNILVMNDNVIAFVDFGIVGYFDKKLKESTTKLFIGIVKHDTEDILEAIMEIGKIDREIDAELFKRNFSRIIYELQAGTEIKDAKVSIILEEILNMGINYGLKLPTEFVLFGKTIITLEGIALRYAPDFRFIDSAEPFIENMQINKLSPERLFSDFVENAIRFKKLLTGFPNKIDKTLDRLQRGVLKFDIEDAEIRRLSFEIDKSSNRIAIGMLISALLVTGALIIQAGTPVAFGLPLASFISFLIAGLLGFILLISILREKNHFEK